MSAQPGCGQFVEKKMFSLNLDNYIYRVYSEKNVTQFKSCITLEWERSGDTATIYKLDVFAVPNKFTIADHRGLLATLYFPKFRADETERFLIKGIAYELIEQNPGLFVRFNEPQAEARQA